MATPYIVAYRQQIERLKATELEKARQLIQQGQDSTQVLERMANTLAAKLGHLPSQLLRHAAMQDNPELLEWTLAEFGLQQTEADPSEVRQSSVDQSSVNQAPESQPVTVGQRHKPPLA